MIKKSIKKTTRKPYESPEEIEKPEESEKVEAFEKTQEPEKVEELERAGEPSEVPKKETPPEVPIDKTRLTLLLNLPGGFRDIGKLLYDRCDNPSTPKEGWKSDVLSLLQEVEKLGINITELKSYIESL